MHLVHSLSSINPLYSNLVSLHILPSESLSVFFLIIHFLINYQNIKSFPVYNQKRAPKYKSKKKRKNTLPPPARPAVPSRNKKIRIIKSTEENFHNTIANLNRPIFIFHFLCLKNCSEFLTIFFFKS